MDVWMKGNSSYPDSASITRILSFWPYLGGVWGLTLNHYQFVLWLCFKFFAFKSVCVCYHWYYFPSNDCKEKVVYYLFRSFKISIYKVRSIGLFLKIIWDYSTGKVHWLPVLHRGKARVLAGQGCLHTIAVYLWPPFPWSRPFHPSAPAWVVRGHCSSHTGRFLPQISTQLLWTLLL